MHLHIFCFLDIIKTQWERAHIKPYIILGATFILRKDIGVGGPETGNFPLLMEWKCPYVGGWAVKKSLKTPLRNIKMAPY